MLWLRIALAPVLLFGVLWAVDLQDVGRVLSGASAGWLAAALARIFREGSAEAATWLRGAQSGRSQARLRCFGI
ncbi:MAG: hypothetical protein DI587_38315, partial [Variovorax paradoxus]